MRVSRQFASASIQHCRWLPCPPAATAAASDGDDGSDAALLDCVDAPVVLAGWSEDAKQHIVAVVDIRTQADAHTLVPGNCVNPRLSAQHSGRVTDLQVRRAGWLWTAATPAAAAAASRSNITQPNTNHCRHTCTRRWRASRTSSWQPPRAAPAAYRCC
jgi:hypothetical protein